MSTDDFAKRFMNAEWVLNADAEAKAVEYRQKAEAVEINSVPFYKIVDLVDDMEPREGFMNVQQIEVLTHLTALADAEIVDTGFPFVFDDNIVLGVDLRLRPRQVSRSLEHLEAQGFITILGERSGRRRRSKNVQQSNAIDLRILIARYEELRP